MSGLMELLQMFQHDQSKPPMRGEPSGAMPPAMYSQRERQEAVKILQRYGIDHANPEQIRAFDDGTRGRQSQMVEWAIRVLGQQ